MVPKIHGTYLRPLMRDWYVDPPFIVGAGGGGQKEGKTQVKAPIGLLQKGEARDR